MEKVIGLHGGDPESALIRPLREVESIDRLMIGAVFDNGETGVICSQMTNEQLTHFTAASDYIVSRYMHSD